MTENDGGGWQPFFRILENLGQKCSCPSCRARSARSLPLSLQEPACPVEVPACQSEVQSRRSVVVNGGDVVPPAWRCESCKQTTPVDGVVSRSSSDVSLRLLADPRAIPYLGPNLPLGATASSACPIVADRISMPRKAAVDDWLPPSLVSAWNHPECEASGIPFVPRYIDVNMAGWRALCRRMLRSGLGKKVHPTSPPFHLSGGAFSVPRDLDRDRFMVTADLGMVQNDSVGRVICLGLHGSDVSCRQVIDVSDCYYAYSVDEKRLQRQVLGQRVLVS